MDGIKLCLTGRRAYFDGVKACLEGVKTCFGKVKACKSDYFGMLEKDLEWLQMTVICAITILRTVE